MGAKSMKRHEQFMQEKLQQAEARIEDKPKRKPLPTDASERKQIPIYTGFIRYFPDAIAAVAKVSLVGVGMRSHAGIASSAFKALSEALSSNSSSIRLTGLSGLGKSRLLIEYKNRSKLKDSDFIIFSGSENEYTVKESIKTAAENGALGFVIIDNCNVELHNYATNAIEVNDSPLKLITTYFYHEEEKKLTNSIRIKLEKLESAQISNIIDSRLPELDQSSKQQLEKFIEGFPLLAQMTIKELQQEGRITTSFSESDLVEKLINGDGNLSDKARELLKVFSLFDYFRFQKGIREDVNEDAEFLKTIAGTDQITFENTIMIFKEKELDIELSWRERFRLFIKGYIRMNRFDSYTHSAVLIKLATEAIEKYGFSIERKSKDNIVNCYGKKLIGICKHCNIMILKGRSMGDQNGEFTCKQSSVVDYCISNTEFLRYVHNVRILPFSSFLSDVHNPIEIVLALERQHSTESIYDIISTKANTRNC